MSLESASAFSLSLSLSPHPSLSHTTHSHSPPCVLSYQCSLEPKSKLNYCWNNRKRERERILQKLFHEKVQRNEYSIECLYYYKAFHSHSLKRKTHYFFNLKKISLLYININILYFLKKYILYNFHHKIWILLHFYTKKQLMYFYNICNNNN